MLEPIGNQATIESYLPPLTESESAMSTPHLDDLGPYAASLARESLTWSDQFWDPQAALLAVEPAGAHTHHHSVRNSLWYALGLMLRNEGDDRARAVQTIAAVLDNQYDAPGTAYHGTFRRWPGEAPPPANPVVWRDYDPNWRQFVGTTLALLLEEFDVALPPALVARMDRAIHLAVVGEPPDRCTPGYTNIALMKAALLTWAGDRYGRAAWRQEGETFGRAVYDLFQKHQTYAEYNSPTYYGVNFYALGLWRRYAKSVALAQLGAEMEAALWRDVAHFYHARLRNVAGPYTRSYGMDMQRYGALLGLSIWLLAGRELAPFPQETGYFDHSHDFCYGPPLALVGTVAPEDTLSHFHGFIGERQVERRIAGADGATPDRLATAWLGDEAMIGAEGTVSANPADAFTRINQFHPVTFHWCAPGGIGWLRLLHLGPVDARAGRGELTMTGPVIDSWMRIHADAHRRYTFQVYAPGGIEPSRLRADGWELPGLSLRVTTDATWAGVMLNGETVEAVYTVAADKAGGGFGISLK
jgi:hypothetical protein